jgi:hypothetical protein
MRSRRYPATGRPLDEILSFPGCGAPVTLAAYTPPGYLFHDHEYFAAISAG